MTGMRPAVVALALSLTLTTAGRARSQEVCPRASGADAQAGWSAYRAGDLGEARARFQAALGRCPDDLYATTGLGYVELRRSSDDRARGLFLRVTAAQPGNVDALVGLGLLAWRAGDLEEVSRRFLRVRELAPDNPTARDYLARLPEGLGIPPERPPLILPDTLVYPARAHGDRFEVRGPDGWVPFYVKGVNLGAALPGRNPSEFPDSATYARWIRGMADMNANAVRVYTIHPPAFYQALYDYDTAHPDQPLWLIHGVWTELPADSARDFLAAAFEDGFFGEMKRVVDLIHGRADVRPRAGHAAGFYTADVSPWTLAYIIGREWEPYSSMAFDSLHAGFTRWDGRYVELLGGNPMETWLAKAVDHMVGYEASAYHAQRPIAYTNWPTFDPLGHPTESSRAQEVALREALGERVDFKPREYDNDVLGLDATKMRATDADPAGVFASFHAYPYYPDFMVLQPSYRAAADSSGESTYSAYLSELKAHHRGMPLLISEYGLPASVGSAHLQPQGLHHGGLTEAAMAAGDVRLTRELAEAGAAGGVVFSWMDEWFKKNWLVIDFELPQERNRLWYNRLDAEQQYGMMAMDAVPAVPGRTLAERQGAWQAVPPLYDGPDGTVRAAADEAYLWLYMDTPRRSDGDTLYVGIDVVDPAAGDHRWPGARGPTLPVGVEFVVRDDGHGVRVLADPPVNPWKLVEVGRGTRARSAPPMTVADAPDGLFQGRQEQRFNLPYVSRANDDGVYDSLRVVSNRRRVGRDSTEYLALGYDRGVLPGGAAPDGFWERRGHVVEIRIPWLLINVTDPSSRTVLADSGAGASSEGRTSEGLVVLPTGEEVAPDSLVGELGTTTVDDIGIVAALAGGDGRWTSLPGNGRSVARFTWPTWDREGVRWQERRRPVFDAMRSLYGTLDPYGVAPVVAAAPPPGRADRPSPVQQVDSAAAAWNAGDTETALRLYRARLARDSTDAVALHRVALMTAWAQRYDASLALFDRLLSVSPDNLDARVDRARVRAWSGDTDGALSALDALLREHPDFVPALEARATFQAWAGHYEAALSSYDRVLAITPEATSVRRQQAQVLSWASRFEQSRAVYDSLLARDPDDVEARLGLARVLSFADELDGAIAQYRRVLAMHPDYGPALQGLGRTLGWAGRLVEGEEAYRRAIAVDSGDVDGWVGLAQNLRWQGRSAAALEVLLRARLMAPSNGDVREQLRQVQLALGPRLSPGVVVEDDSEDNHMVSTTVTSSWHPLARLAFRADAYDRSLSRGPLTRSAYGLSVTGSWQAEPGWTWSAGLGGSRNDGHATTSLTTWTLGVSSPGRYHVGGTVTLASSALDATALLAENGVRTTGVSAMGRWTPAPRWRVDGSLGRTSFEGTQDNRRVNVALSVSRRLRRMWTLGTGVRAFGFQKDLADGYFDPDFYGIAEVTGRWSFEPGAWSFLVEVAPGVQQVTKDGDPAGAFRASARLAYRLAPRREISVAGGFSSTGLQTFSTGTADYRYTALIVGGSWIW